MDAFCEAELSIFSRVMRLQVLAQLKDAVTDKESKEMIPKEIKGLIHH